MKNLLLRDLVEGTGTVGTGWVGGVGAITHHLLQGEDIIKGDVLLLTSQLCIDVHEACCVDRSLEFANATLKAPHMILDKYR